MDLYTVFKLSSSTVLYEGILINLEQAPFFTLQCHSYLWIRWIHIVKISIHYNLIKTLSSLIRAPVCSQWGITTGFVLNMPLILHWDPELVEASHEYTRAHVVHPTLDRVQWDPHTVQGLLSLFWILIYFNYKINIILHVCIITHSACMFNETVHVFFHNIESTCMFHNIESKTSVHICFIS